MTITLSTAVQGSLHRRCTLTGMSIERRFIGSATFGVGLWFLDVVAEAAQFVGFYRLKRSRLRRFGEGLERLAKEQWSGFWLRALPARSQPTRRWSVPMVIVTGNAMRCSISLRRIVSRRRLIVRPFRAPSAPTCRCFLSTNKSTASRGRMQLACLAISFPIAVKASLLGIITAEFVAKELASPVAPNLQVSV